MKKIIFTAILFQYLLINTTIVAQTNKAIYSVTIQNDKEVKGTPIENFYITAQENSSLFNFQLNFSKKESDFFMVQNLEVEYQSFNFVKGFSKYQGFTSIRENMSYVEKEIDAKSYILKSEFNPVWNLTTETKKIDNYICNKATSQKTFKFDTTERTLQITAWYCPEIPYQFGPNGYGNLPGLIVELQIDKVIYGLKSIYFDDKTIKFQEIDVKKVISKEKYDEIIKEKMKFILDE